MRLGIDFGTTRTVIAAAVDGRYPTASFANGDDYRGWLSGAAAWHEGRWVFGDAAARYVQEGRAGTIRSLKRELAARSPDDLLVVDGADPTSALAMATGYAEHVRDAIVHRSNLSVAADEPLEAMIAVPASASSRQRFLTLEAFRRAGFDVLGMLNEPSAAAVEFAHRDRRVLSPRSPKRYVVVYDLGGGTFDVSAVSLRGHRFDMLASEGIARLGGDDFDAAILDLWQERLGRNDMSAGQRHALLEVCRRAKEALTPQSRRVFLDPAPELGVAPAAIDLDEVCAACAPLVERTIALLDDVFARLPADVDVEDARQLGAVYLVGGAVGFREVTRQLRARYQKKVLLAQEPHASTAIGLAVAADPESGVLVREATTRYFGVWREGDGGKETIFDPLLRKDEVPDGDARLVIERVYRPAHTVGHLRFIECTRLDQAGQPSGDLAPFGELWFPYDPSLEAHGDLREVPVRRDDSVGAATILERYEYSPDGTISVRIENQTHRYSREIVLGAAPRL